MFQIYQHAPCRALLLGGSKIPTLFARNISFAPRFFCFDDKEKKDPLTITKIQNLLKCEQKQARTFFETMDIKSQWRKGALLIDTLKFLINSGVTMESMLENPKLFATSDLKVRLSFIQEMNPNDINDFVPLLTFSKGRLKCIVDTAKRDLHVLPDGYVHRIYYFSDKLQTSPKVISKRFVDNPFMFFNKFEVLDNNLEIFLEYDIKPDNLIRDIGVFRHSEEMILARLNRVKAANISKVMPWMIKCVDAVFESVIQNRVEEREALGNNDSVKSFLVEHLDLDEQDATVFLENYPRLLTKKVRKMKNIIDYLLSETSYTKEDIVSTPQILYFSLETIEKRIDELRMAGVSLPRLTKLVQGQGRFNKLRDGA